MYDPWADSPVERVPSEINKIISAYRSAFASVAGTKVLEDLRAAFGDRMSFIPGMPDETSFREGQRSVYLRIMVMLKAELEPETTVEAEVTDNG